MEFSVVVPTYKRIEKLCKCLEVLVGQDFDELYEIIVIEDSDEEGGGVEELVKEPRKRVTRSRGVKGLTPRRCEPLDTSGSRERYATITIDITYLSQPHRGPAAARNKGIKAARGKYIAFTDDDCIVPSNWLARLEEGFEKYRNVAGVGGYMEAPEEILKKNAFAQYESYITRKVYGAGDKELIGGFEVPTGGTNNIAYRKDVLEEVGGFDENFPIAAGEDADLKKRICDKGYKIAYLPLKVEHHHSFFTSSFPKNLFQFCTQGWRRGVGSAYFHRKHGGGLGRARLIINLLLLPFRFVGESIFKHKLPRKAICVKYIAVLFDSLAQLFY